MTIRLLFWLSGTAMFLAVSFLLVPPGLAQSPFNHLKCYTVEDSLPAAQVPLTLSNPEFGDEACTILQPARLFCAQASKTLETPGVDPRSNAAGHFLCYRTRGCPVVAEKTFAITDQFGAREAETNADSVVRWFCAPVTLPAG